MGDFIVVSQGILYVILAPAVVGLLDWFKARLQRRRGADWRQPYRNLGKLLRREPNVPVSTTFIFMAAPPIIFCCYLLLGFFLPTFFHPTPDSAAIRLFPPSLDFFFVASLLLFAKFAAGLAIFDVGSALGRISSGRQLFIHILIEPILILAVYALVLLEYNGHTSAIDQLISFLSNREAGEASIVGGVEMLFDPALAAIVAGLCLVFLVESGRLPFDAPETQLELTMIERGVYLEYSGYLLALWQWAEAMKLTFFCALLVSLALPWTITTTVGLLPLLTAAAWYLVKMGAMIGLIALWENGWIRLELRRMPTYLVAALVPIILAIVYVFITGGR